MLSRLSSHRVCATTDVLRPFWICSAGIAPYATDAPAKAKRGRKPAPKKTREVPALGLVSEDLCDDILKQLGPSLEKHKGCDIIDICPGEGLWSRKLHEVLQPQSHHIIEIAGGPYKTLWQPELKKPGTKYQWTTFSKFEHLRYGANWNPLMDDVIPPRLATADSTKPQENINNTILLLVNTSRIVKKSKRLNKIAASDSPSEPLIYLMLENLRYKTGLQSAGAVRILLWTTQNDKYNILPRDVAHRNKIDIDSQEVYFAQEITGEADFSAATRRGPTYDVLSAYQTALRMKESGVELPEHRRPGLHQKILDSMAANEGTGDLPEVISQVNELRDLESAALRGDFPTYVPHAPGEDKRRSKYSKQYMRLLELREQLNALTGYIERRHHDLDSYVSVFTAIRNIFDYERDLRRKYPDGDRLELHTEEERAMMKAMEDRLEQAWEARSGREFRRRRAVSMLVDNEEALRITPPLLDWDRRFTEPLNCFSHEFDPPNVLSLLDLQPLADGPYVRDGRSTTRTPFINLLRYMRADTIFNGLNSMAHGAADAIIPQCPSLTDPAKGGHVHLENVTVRLLTHDQFKELNDAWNRWPFKVSDEVLQTRINLTSIYSV